MDYQDTLDQLNITLGDTGDVTFTPEEKARALQKAWNDSYVVDVTWDSSKTFSSTTYQYALPSGMKTVKDIYISPTNDSSSAPSKIDASLYEVVDGNIQFKNNALAVIPEGYTLYIKGGQKLDHTSDTLTSTNMQEYVIALAGYNTLMLLGFKKANLFLKNDTTMGELIALKRDLKDDVRELRAKLHREFEGV